MGMSENREIFFRMRNIVKKYALGEEEATILKGISLNIDQGEFLSVLGPSGSGKSTLMNIIGCLDKPTSGEYILHGDTLELFRARKSRMPAGVMHCYTGSVESAREYLTLGLYISFSGSVTFKNAHHLQDVARFVPADRLLVETDSPYLAPVPMRGQRNEPAYVRYVASTVADLRGVPLEELIRQTTANVERLYKRMEPAR